MRWLLDERKILAIIFVNALVLAALGFPTLPPRVAIALNLLDHLITLLFCWEAATKIRALGFRAYWASPWDRFDFLLLGLALPSFAAELGGFDDLDFKYLLALRVGRAFKFFRTLRFVPNVQELFAGIQRAMRTSIALMLGFFIGLFIISLLSSRLFSDVSPEHYGDPLRALYSTFKIFTVEGWFEIPDAVAGQLSGAAALFARLYFSTILLVCGVFGLSLLNSVFVDAMVADNNDALERKVDALTEELRLLRADLAPRRSEEPRQPGSEAPPP